MQFTLGSFLKGAGLGMALGCVAGVVGSCMMKKSKRSLKHSADKAMHSFGELMDNVTDMF